jgi:hypothetical protein
MATSKADEWEQMVKDCEARESKLSEWEAEFIDSIGARVNAGLPLSEKQETTLEKIWGKST